MNDGRLSRKRGIKPGYGLLCVERHEKRVSYARGDRRKSTCSKLWEDIPEAYRVGHCLTDFWSAYRAVIPEEQHTAVGKETGETAHVERWNTTLRQRLAHFVRQTLSFSNSLEMHDLCLRLFLHRYNLERASILI
jgi:insertion element IS1 protein InsB